MMERRSFLKTTSIATLGVTCTPRTTTTANDYHGVLSDFFKREYPKRLNDPVGSIVYPYIDPGAAYDGLCWDWDAYFSLRGLNRWKQEVAPYAEGCVRNFLHFQGPDGSVPYAFTPGKEHPGKNRPENSDRNSCKPLLAQFALMAHEYSGSESILRDSYEGLFKHTEHWESSQLSRLGLFTFRSHRGSGVDDHPAVYCRPLNSSADVFLNSMFFKEYKALEEICMILGNKEEDRWRFKADNLSESVNQHMWDPIDQTYYNLEVGYHRPGRVNQEVTWVLPLKVRSWTCFMPLWAGIASKSRAETLVNKHLTNESEYWSPNGMRSMSKKEGAYEIAIGSNPSCWRGPVWVVNNFMIYEGLKNYDYADTADELGMRLVSMLEKDIGENGCLHEYYDPESGKGLTHPGFINWNTLSLLMSKG
jgi:putative isomerase